MTIIGLDPAMRKYGFGKCEINLDTKVIDFHVFANLGQFYNYFYVFNNLKANDKTIFGIENSNEQRNEYWNHIKGAAKNQGISQCIYEMIKEFKYKVISISPKEKGFTLPLSFVMGIIKKDFSEFKVNGISDKSDKMAAFQIANLVYKQEKFDKNV